MDLAHLRVVFESQGFDAVLGEIDRSHKAVDTSQRKFSELSTSVGKGMTITGAAITGALGLFTKGAGDFETGMRNVGTLGVTNMDELREGVLDFSTTMGKDAVQSTEDLYQILSKGIPEANALEILESSAKAAAAGVGETSDALDLGTSVINAYGLEISDFEGIMGAAVTAVKNGSTTIGDMGSVIGRVAPIASQAGISFEELFAGIAGITATGTQTSEAISGLKAAITNVIKPTSDAQKVSESLGLEFNATALQSQGLAGFLDSLMQAIEGNSGAMAENADVLEGVKNQTNAAAQAAQQRLQVVNADIEQTQQAIEAARAQGEATGELEQKLSELNSEQQTLTQESQTFGEQLNALRENHEELQGASDDTLTTMAALFGSVEGLNAMLALTGGKGAEIFQRSLNEMSQGGNILNQVFERWAANNPSFQLEQAKAAFNRIAITIGNVLLPIVADLFEGLVPVAEWIAAFVKEHPTFSKAIIVSAGAFGMFNLVLGPIVMKLPKLLHLLTSITGLNIAMPLTAAGSALSGLGVALHGVGAGLVWVLPHLTVLAAAMLILAPLIKGVAHEYRLWRDAVEEQRQSEERLGEQVQKYKTQLMELGVVIDEEALKDKSYTEQMMALREMERNSMDETLRHHLQSLATREEAQKAFGMAKNLMLNEEITAEEAARIALMDIALDLKKELIQADEEKTQALLEHLGIRTQAAEEAAGTEQQLARDTGQAEKEATAAMKGALSELERVTAQYGDSVEQTTQTVDDSMQQLATDNADTVQNMSSRNVESLNQFGQSGVDNMHNVSQASAEFGGTMQQLPSIAGGAMQGTSGEVRQAAMQMINDLRAVQQEMQRLDANARHSPSVNDRVRSGLQTMQTLFGGGMEGVRKQTHGTIQYVAGGWSQLMEELSKATGVFVPFMGVSEKPEIHGFSVASRSNDAASHLGSEFNAASGQSGWDAFSQGGAGAAGIAAGTSGVTINITGLQVTKEADVDKVIAKIGQGVKQKLIMGGVK